MSDRPPGKQSKKSRLLRPIKEFFSRSFSRSSSHQVTQSLATDSAIASISALPTNATSASQVNPQSHQEARSVTADNAIASIPVLSTNSTTSTTSTPQEKPQSPQETQPVTPDVATASISTSPMKSSTPAHQVNPQGTEYTAILELSPKPSGPLTREYRMKAFGNTAYEGLKTAIQGVHDCSGMFPPLQTTAGVLLTICKVVDVGGSMCSTCNYVITDISFCPFRKFQEIRRILNSFE